MAIPYREAPKKASELEPIERLVRDVAMIRACVMMLTLLAVVGAVAVLAVAAGAS